MTDEDYDAKYRSAYDSGAKDYDRDRFGSFGHACAKQYKNGLILRILREHNCLGEDARILDIPSGTGRVAHALLRHSPVQVFAADISREMLNVNFSNLEDPWKPRISLREADMKQIPATDAYFDAAVMASFFYLIPLHQYREYVRDVVRTLKPGGIMIAELSNALPALNPVTLAAVLYHKHIRKIPVKSYAYVWNLSCLFSPLQVVSVHGTEYPLIWKNYRFYESTCNMLGSWLPTKWLGGKFTLVLRKPG